MTVDLAVFHLVLDGAPTHSAEFLWKLKMIPLLKRMCAVSTWICVMTSSSVFAAEERATTDEAVKLVGKAVAFLKKNGEEKAFEAFNKSKAENGEFIDRDLYLFVYDTKGFMHAISNGNAKKKVGKDLIELGDAEGVYLVKGLIATIATTEMNGVGSFHYRFPNPVTKSVEPKSGYCERVADKLICSGIYKK